MPPRAFYAAVFGWTWDPFPMGDQEGTLFRLPGYVGGEAEQPVPRDVVAVMLPSSGRTVGVDRGLLGRGRRRDRRRRARPRRPVVAGPFDSGISRDAVIADPAGAVFSVSTAPNQG